MSLDYVPLSMLLAIPPEYGANASAAPPNGTDPRYLRITDISDSGRLLFDDIKSISRKIAQFSLLQQDDIVIARTGNTVGKSYLHEHKNGELAFAGYLIRFRIDQSKADPNFVFHFLHSPDYYSWKDKTLRTGAQPNINAQEYSRLQIPNFKLSEQRKIAKILSTLENLIAQTHSLIAKYHAIKQGMMQDLFTRGVDESGRLRPSHEYAPEQYTSSEIGSIPKDWKLLRLSQLYSIPSRNGLYKPKDYYGSGSPMVHMPQMFRSLVVDTSDASRVQLNDSEKTRYELQEGDLLFARRSLTLEGAGQCAIIPRLSELTTFESSIIRVRLNSDAVHPEFVNHFLNTSQGFQLRLPLIRQVAVSGVSADDISKIPIPCPKIREQETIVERIECFDSLIERETKNLVKLNSIKNGLMQDLLTGKIKVKVNASTESTQDVGVHQS